MKPQFAFRACLAASLFGLAAPAFAQDPADPHASLTPAAVHTSPAAAEVVAAKPSAPAPAAPRPPALIDVSAPAQAKALVIMFSGDGGWWGDLDRKLAEKMASEGYAVVAVDTQAWFKTKRTPAEIAAHIAGIAKDYRARTGAKDVVLAGYSFGADMLPLAYNHMSPSAAKSIAALVMVSPARATDPQVTVLEQTGMGKPTIGLAPEFTKLPVHKLICVYGAEEAAESGCTTPQLAISKTIELPGSHHYDGVPEHMTEPVTAALMELVPPK